MKKYLSHTGALLMLLATACNNEKDLYLPPTEGGGNVEVTNTFDFSTVETPEIEVSYGNIGFGNLTTSVYFEIYTENPLVEGEYGTFTRKAGVNPVFNGYTAEDGTWKGKVELPSYTKTVYVYTPAFFAQKLMSAEVNGNGTLVLSDAGYQDTKGTRSTVQNGKAPYKTSAVETDGWKTWLGRYSTTGMESDKTDYNKYSGGIEYANQFSDGEAEQILNITPKKALELLSIHQAVINRGKPCQESYRTSQDLTITKDANVAITLLGGDTGWSNSMGYYYYKESDGVPTQRSQVSPILVVPNTQDGKYNSSTAQSAKGIERGTTVQLYFYGFGDEFSEANKSAIFPEGTKIGFILKSHAWNHGNCWQCGANHTDSNGFFSTTTPGLNTSSSKFSTGSGVAMFTPDGENLLISFEDHSDDNNFSDVVFTMSTNPIGAFTDVNTLEESETQVTIEKGVYAFEDLWPSKGDYDMNDVVVEASAKKVMTTKKTTITTTGSGAATKTEVYPSKPYLASESFLFVPYANYALKNNGLAFTYVLSKGITAGNIESYSLTIDGKEANVTYDEADKVFYLTDNVKNFLGKEFCLTVAYKAPVWNEASKEYIHDHTVATTEQCGIKPFIYRSEGEKNWEVHVPFEAPTGKMNLEYFGTGDDRSENGNYYVRTGNYPFAFYLSGATHSDIAPLLEEKNESKAIDVLYPTFADWATSNGATNQNWYKK